MLSSLHNGGNKMANSDYNLFDEPILKSNKPTKPAEKVGFFQGIKLKWQQHKEKKRLKQVDKADELYNAGINSQNNNHHESAIFCFEKAQKIYDKTGEQAKVNLCKQHITTCKKKVFDLYFSSAKETNLKGVQQYKAKNYDAAYNTFISAQRSITKAHSYGWSEESSSLSKTIEKNVANAEYWKDQVIANSYYTKAKAKNEAGDEYYYKKEYFSALSLFKEAWNLANDGVPYDNTANCQNLRATAKKNIDATECRIAEDYTDQAIDAHNEGVEYWNNKQIAKSESYFKEAYDLMCKACNYYDTDSRSEKKEKYYEDYLDAYHYDNDKKVERALDFAEDYYSEAKSLYNRGVYRAAVSYADKAIERLGEVRRYDRKDLTDDLWDNLKELSADAWREYMYEDDYTRDDD